MISASIDRPKLERSLKDYAKRFGDSSAQAIARWGVQACRELAFETQVWGKTRAGKSKGAAPTAWAKGAQEGAIVADAYKVLVVKPIIGKRNKKNLTTPSAVNAWIEMHRTRRGGRTARLPIEERRICSEATFKKAMKIRFKKAGMAKGGWIGAGMQAASYQKGQDRINIGKNFMSWTQKHASFGSATKPQAGFSPFSRINNRVKHTSVARVLNPSRAARAIDFGLKKTITWYRSALRAIDKKQKP